MLGYPGMPKNDPILVADGIRRQFGGLAAVDVDHLEVERNRITALIGPNGAGKTTFFNLLTGFDTPDHGVSRFNGQLMSDSSAHKVAKLGMVRTFQLTKALARLTVIENMRLGAPNQRGERLWAGPFKFLWRDEEAQVTERADALLERFKLSHMRDEFAGGLSGGQRKLLEMARALMTDPTLIMLDEPMAGVNPGAQTEPARSRQGAQGRGAHGAVRRARHGHGPRDQRLGRRDGGWPHHRRGHRRRDLRQVAK